MKVKEESEKVDLKLSFQKTKIIASGPITSWQIDGETVTDFILGGSKITADGDCRKVMTNLDNRRGQWQLLQYSCLENPMDGGAWWAAIYGVTQSRTRLM